MRRTKKKRGGLRAKDHYYGLSSFWRVREEGWSTSAKPRQTVDGAAAVIAIRPLCIKHTFVESKERREREREEEEREMEKKSRVKSSQRSI